MTDIKTLQSAYLRAVTERDNAIFQLTRLKAERDKAVEDLKCAADCDTCKHFGSCEFDYEYKPCKLGVTTECYEWRGLEE